jgi:hypothetical protein
MDAPTIVYGLLLAILGTVAIILVPNIPFYFIRKRLLQRFAQLQCGKCQKPSALRWVVRATMCLLLRSFGVMGKATTFTTIRLACVLCAHIVGRVGFCATTAKVKNLAQNCQSTNQTWA